MGAYITPATLTEHQSNVLASEGFQCSGGFTYSTINVTIMEANDSGADIHLEDGVDTYGGRVIPTPEDVAALYEVAETAEAGVGPEYLRGRGGPRVIANAFRAAMLRGEAVVWG
jgi:hypothetical protein